MVSERREHFLAPPLKKGQRFVTFGYLLQRYTIEVPFSFSFFFLAGTRFLNDDDEGGGRGGGTLTQMGRRKFVLYFGFFLRNLFYFLFFLV